MRLHRAILLLVCLEVPSTLASSFSRPDFGRIHRGGSTILGEEDRASNNTPLFALTESATPTEASEEIYVQKRDGSTDLLNENKVRNERS
jgi:hypothetical protein